MNLKPPKYAFPEGLIGRGEPVDQKIGYRTDISNLNLTAADFLVKYLQQS
jgi:hypothetical protein